jgi:hypothetical protein
MVLAGLRKGIAQHVMWLVFGVILMVVTGALLYLMLPHSDCDSLAQLSANEVKAAIECAAKYSNGKDPVTGHSCNVATVKLCQESTFSIYGVGFVQAYMGLMVPEYMIYYQQFPTQQYQSALKGISMGFSESYPFERAYLGQRPYDIRPTLTQFKQFFKTQYLQKPCTTGQGLCFNVRGREDVILVDGQVPDVRLQRAGFSFAETNPKFYLVSPCYGKVTFKKGSDGKIYGSPERLSVTGASNYCYADETMLGGLMALYTGEGACEAGMIALDILSLGSKKAVEEGAVEASVPLVKVEAKEAARETAKEVADNVVKQFGKNLGKEAEQAAAEGATKEVVEKFTIGQMEQTAGKDFVQGGADAGAKAVLGTPAGKLLPDDIAKATGDIATKVIERAAPESFAKETMGTAAEDGIRYTFANGLVKDMSPEVADDTFYQSAKRALKAYDPTLTEKALDEQASAAAKRAIESRGEQPISKAMEETATEAIQKTEKFGMKVQMSSFEEANSEAVKTAGTETAGYIDETAPKLAASTREEFTNEFASTMGKNAKTGFSGLSPPGKANVISKALLNRYATMEGLPTSKPEMLLKSFGILPCVDVDVCRSSSACGETLMWPGLPFAELTDKNMKGGKPFDTVTEVFYQCCDQLNYGAEKDTDKINCTSPDYLVSLIKPDLGLNDTDSVTLTKAGGYLGLTKDKIPSACGLTVGENSKTCRDAMEIRALHLVDNCQADVSEHTYDFGDIKSTNQVTVLARLYRSDCPAQTNIFIEISNDTKSWIEANKTTAMIYPNDNIIYVFGPHTFRYLKVREDGACYFDTSSVVLDPLESRVTEAQADVTYPLTEGTYNYFTMPANYVSNASALCKSVKACTTVAKWQEDNQGWLKWADEGGGPEGTDFNIFGGDKIGIYVTSNSEVRFTVG